MNNIKNPIWLVITNTLPILIVFLLYGNYYEVINSLLNEQSLSLWKAFGIALAVLGGLHLVYAAYLIKCRRDIHTVYPPVALLVYIGFLYLYGDNMNNLIPFNIPRWMISSGSEVYIGTFIMPTLIHAMFMLVVNTTPRQNPANLWKDFSAIIVVPVTWYFFTQVVLPLFKPTSDNFTVHTVLVITIASTVVFLFFLIRGIYRLALKDSGIVRKYQLIWKIPFTIIFPLLGLMLNNGVISDLFAINGYGVFGDFSNDWFYILAVLNGLLLCLPRIEDIRYRLPLFIGRSITFTYTLYFFIVFLPFLPLSIVAIVFFGTGFLMLTPLVLLVIHANELRVDVQHLVRKFSITHLYAFMAAGCLVLPFAITVNYQSDRSVLHQTLDYLYTPDYSRQYTIDTHSLAGTLDAIKFNKKRSRSPFFDSQTPYLSSYFNWLVLDNLTLSDSKIAKIEKVFFAGNPPVHRQDDGPPTTVKLSGLTSSSRFDAEQNAWISRIELELKNTSNDDRPAEYVTTIDLPTACWISDYYLYIDNEPQPGLLVEKKAAMWVYSQIVSEKRDPGILYYLQGNRVALRVFPFSRNQIRKTGIEFIHREPVVLTIDKRSVTLGKPMSQASSQTSGKVLYIAAHDKAKLDKTYRQAYFHFIVDVSKHTQDKQEDFINRIESLLAKESLPDMMHKISFTNAYTTTYALDSDWKQYYANQPFEGGFFLERAIESILVNAYHEHSKSYPVIVVITDDMQHAIIDHDFAELRFTYPENNRFYHLDNQGRADAHSLLSHPGTALATKVSQMLDKRAVRAFPDKTHPLAYLPDRSQPDIILQTTMFDIADDHLATKSWQSGLMMQAVRLSQILHPEIAKNHWRDLVRYSMSTGIMTPLSSYLVVENEAQRQALLNKQQQILAGHHSLDPGEDVLRMSEPGLQLLTLLLIVVLYRGKMAVRR